jgi:hypothetical protein
MIWAVVIIGLLILGAIDSAGRRIARAIRGEPEPEGKHK